METQQIIGHFKVRDENHQSLHVIICQEAKLDANQLITKTKKAFKLNDMEGEEISTTDNPDIFIRKDGSILKKMGLIKTNDIEELQVSKRNRRQYY